jgi:hypothetical protein
MSADAENGFWRERRCGLRDTCLNICSVPCLKAYTLNEVPPSLTTEFLNPVLKYFNAKHDRDIDDCPWMIERLKQKKRLQVALLDSAPAYISYEWHWPHIKANQLWPSWTSVFNQEFGI